MHRRLRSWLTLAHVLLGTVGQSSNRRSVVEVVAEAASRGVRYDKYFAIGKFSRHKFNRWPLSAVRAGNNFAAVQLFSCISPRDSVLVFRNKFSGDGHASSDLVRWLRAVSWFCRHRPVS